jgi:hypothetical protein
MYISFPSHHTWFKFVAAEPLSQFGKNAAAQLRSSISSYEDHNIEVEVTDIDPSFLSWFVPLYVERMAKKEHPAIFDIRAHIEKGQSRFPYKAMILKEDDVPLGAMIFTLRTNKVSIAFRTFSPLWNEAKLAASPSLFMEYQICLYAQKMGKRVVTHGKDSNPYGPHLNIGLAMFKLASGFKVRTSGTFEVEKLDTQSISENTLVLALPEGTSRRIKTGYLLVRKEDVGKYAQLTKYPLLLSIETISID